MKECDLLLTAVPRLVPVHIEGMPPTYYIVAGLRVHDRVRALPQE